MSSIRAVDAHVGGQVLRLITGGAPRTPGKTIAQKQSWLLRHGEAFRRAVVLEPRGHADVTAAMLLEPSLPGAHAGLLFMDADGQPALSGHGLIAAATIAIERGLLFSRDERDAELELVFETVAGLIPVRARVEERGGTARVDAAAFTNVPAFVIAPAHPVQVGTRELRVDLAFGGVFCAIVDTEAVGIPLDVSRVSDLRRFGRDLLQALNGATAVVHPLDASQKGVASVIFTGPPRDPEAHLRNVAVSRGGVVDRSPGGTGTSAVMAVLDAMGFLPEGQPFVHEGLLGGLLRGTVSRRVPVGDYPGLVTTVEGTAWITADHTFLLDDDDPFRDGFRL